MGYGLQRIAETLKVHIPTLSSRCSRISLRRLTEIAKNQTYFPEAPIPVQQNPYYTGTSNVNTVVVPRANSTSYKFSFSQNTGLMEYLRHTIVNSICIATELLTTSLLIIFIDKVINRVIKFNYFLRRTLRTSIFANLFVYCMHITATEISINIISIVLLVR